MKASCGRAKSGAAIVGGMVQCLILTSPPRPHFSPTRVDANTIAWRHALEDGPGRARSFRLHYSKDASMRITGE